MEATMAEVFSCPSVDFTSAPSRLKKPGECVTETRHTVYLQHHVHERAFLLPAAATHVIFCSMPSWCVAHLRLDFKV
jgi:hypothetical protein